MICCFFCFKYITMSHINKRNSNKASLKSLKSETILKYNKSNHETKSEMLHKMDY